MTDTATGTRRVRWLPYLFVATAVLYLVLFMGVPIGSGIRLGFTDTSILNPNAGQFIGADNYSAILADHGFWATLWVTLVYTAFTVVFSLVLGVVSAVAINNAFRGRAFARAVLIMPWAAPTVALALVFAWMYNNDNGVFNFFTSSLGFGRIGWLTDPTWAMFSVTAATVWKLFPFAMLVLLAALQSVSGELYEAARVDGADALNTFKTIVLPALMPTIRVLALLLTIWSFRRFEIIWLLTGGGPVDKTNTVVIDVFREAFINSDLGRSAAIGTLGLVMSLLATVIYFIVDRRSAGQEV